MSFTFPPEFEDIVTRAIVENYAHWPEGLRREPLDSDELLKNLRIKLGVLAHEHGAPDHLSRPHMKDIWTNRNPEPDTYEVIATWAGLRGKPKIEVPVLPRDAA